MTGLRASGARREDEGAARHADRRQAAALRARGDRLRLRPARRHGAAPRPGPPGHPRRDPRLRRDAAAGARALRSSCSAATPRAVQGEGRHRRRTSIRGWPPGHLTGPRTAGSMCSPSTSRPAAICSSDRFIAFWRRQEETGTWLRLERAVEGYLHRAREARRTAKAAERARSAGRGRRAGRPPGRGSGRAGPTRPRARPQAGRSPAASRAGAATHQPVPRRPRCQSTHPGSRPEGERYMGIRCQAPYVHLLEPRVAICIATRVPSDGLQALGASGLPAVAVDEGGPSSIVADGETGRLVRTRCRVRECTSARRCSSSRVPSSPAMSR